MGALKQKTLIVTGASRGIGRALAMELAAAGVNLVLNARDEELLTELSVACETLGSDVRKVAGNAAETEIASELVAVAAASGDFHGFVQAAGVLHPGPWLWELPEKHFHEIHDSIVVASYQLIRFAIPQLLSKGAGLAVFFGSGAAELSVPGIGVYGGAKAAQEHMARQLAVESPTITSFIYRPGVVETQMQQQAREAQGGAAEGLRQIFHGFRERGELLTAETSAKALVRILMHDPGRFHGRIATWEDGLRLPEAGPAGELDCVAKGMSDGSALLFQDKVGCAFAAVERRKKS